LIENGVPQHLQRQRLEEKQHGTQGNGEKRRQHAWG
jgi:hypothetical protein